MVASLRARRVKGRLEVTAHSRRGAPRRQHRLHLAPLHTMVGQGHLQMKHQIGRLTGDLAGVLVVLPGSGWSRRASITRISSVQASAGGGIGAGAAGTGARALVVEAAAGAGVAGHLAHLLHAEQQQIGVAVIAGDAVEGEPCPPSA